MIDLDGRVKKNLEDAVRRCIELKGLKHTDIVEVGPRTYKHTNMRNKDTLYVCLSTFGSYSKWCRENPGKEKRLHRVNGFYIIELKREEQVS